MRTGTVALRDHRACGIVCGGRTTQMASLSSSNAVARRSVGSTLALSSPTPQPQPFTPKCWLFVPAVGVVGDTRGELRRGWVEAPS